MLRTRVIALTAMVTCGLVTAQAADQTLTLACQGTVTVGVASPEPISTGIIVNFTKQTVHGFSIPFFGEQPITITDVTETLVYFSASSKLWSAIGTIDRVTGDVEASFWVTDAKTGTLVTSTNYALKCRPTQRMF